MRADAGVPAGVNCFVVVCGNQNSSLVSVFRKPNQNFVETVFDGYCGVV